jgi:hypothetical protein
MCNTAYVGQLAQEALDMDAEIPKIRRYQAGDRLYVQAQRIWLILVAYVQSHTWFPEGKETLIYGELAELMGYPDRRAGHMLGRQLGIVGQYCLLNGLPALNSIVVTATTGMPGDDVVLTKGRTVRQEQRAVLATDWFQFGVPTTGTLRKVWASMQ